MKYVVDGVEKLDREVECGQCGVGTIVAYCNNDLTLIGHVDLFGNTDGDYFYFCTNDKCLHSIGVYEGSGGYDYNSEELYVGDILQGTFYKDTIINLFESLNVLNNTYVNAKVDELKELKDRYNDLQFEHAVLVNQGRVDEAVAMVKQMVETNNQIIQIEKSGYAFHIPTKQEIADVENMIYTLLKYNGVG